MGGVPAQTSFLLPPHSISHGWPSLLLERGVHKPPPAEHLAPFYRDPAQRIAALAIPDLLCYLVFPVEALVKLAEGCEGCEIEWDEWKEHVVIPSIHVPDLVDIWVSGCRLFCITSSGYGRSVNVEVYDFSKKGRVKYLDERVDLDLGGVRYLSSTGVYTKLPCDTFELIGTGGGWDSAIFFAVSVIALFFSVYFFAFNVSTLLSSYDSNDFTTIPFYCYLYLILRSLSFIRNKDLMDFLRLRLVTTNYSISREKSHYHHRLPPHGSSIPTRGRLPPQ